MGVIIAVIPKTPKMLKMFEPNKFPRDMAFSFLMTAITEAANSGTLVPTETIVIPITRSETPKKVAKPTAPEINNSEPPQSPKPPNTYIIKSL